MSFSYSQMRGIEITEKVCSILSLLGATFIITTFIFDKSFHKPINRLVFFAAWGNILSNVATLISLSGIRLGIHTPLCQFQAFLVQWFMPADALWTFAMALNVYLTFFRQYDAHQLRSFEWRYLLCCYGIPFIPAFVFCFVESQSRGKVYGSAVLWCWISIEWDYLRVAAFYGPIWLVIFMTFGIYLSAGRVVLRWRLQLIKYAETQTNTSEDGRPQSHFDVPRITKTTEISGTTELGPIEEGRYQSRTSNMSSSQAKEVQIPMSPTLSEPTARNKSCVSIDANKAAISYCKCALLFFVALLVTWVPSTVNRIVTLVHPTQAVFWLNYTSGLVLPLQGFWNALVYIMTSLPACSALLHRIAALLQNSAHGGILSRKRTSLYRSKSDVASIPGRTKTRRIESESLEDLRETWVSA